VLLWDLAQVHSDHDMPFWLEVGHSDTMLPSTADLIDTMTPWLSVPQIEESSKLTANRIHSWTETVSRNPPERRLDFDIIDNSCLSLASLALTKASRLGDRRFERPDGRSIGPLTYVLPSCDAKESCSPWSPSEISCHWV